MKKKVMAIFMASFMLVTIFGASFSVQSAESVKDSMPETSENEIQSSGIGTLTIHTYIKGCRNYYEYALGLVKIYLVESGGVIGRTKYTNLLGNAKFHNLNVGSTYLVTLSRSGYKTKYLTKILESSRETWNVHMMCPEDIDQVDINSVSNNLLPVQESVEPTENSISETPENEIESSTDTSTLMISTDTDNGYYYDTVSFAPFTISDNDGTFHRNSITSFWGLRTFWNLQSGHTYTVTVNKRGYVPKTIERKLGEGMEIWDFHLSRNQGIPQVDINSVSNNLLPVQESVEPAENSISETSENEIESSTEPAPGPLLIIETRVDAGYTTYPVPYAPFTISDNDGSLYVSSITNARGSRAFLGYVYPIFQIGHTYTVTVNKKGYVPKTIERKLEGSYNTWAIHLVQSHDIPEGNINSVCNNLIS